MSKTISEKPIFVKNVADLKNIKTVYKQNQTMAFICQNCNKLDYKKLYVFKKDIQILLCKSCGIKLTCLKKYGVENPSQAQEIKEKKKQTCLRHYGVESPQQCITIKEKLEQTCLERYGCKRPSQANNVKEKTKQTCLKKYGEVSISKTFFVKEKIKEAWKHKSVEEKLNIQEKAIQTCLKKYGVKNPNQSKEIQERAKQTCLKRYGVSHPFKSETIQEKIKQTLMKRYNKIRTPKHLYKKDGLFFDSSWELAVWIWANETGKQIKREPIGLEYKFEGKVHTYYPDFDIDNQLVEVKGNHFFKEDGTMKHPYNISQNGLYEAKHQCGIRNNVQFWTKKEISPILTYMVQNHGKNWAFQYRKK